MIARVHVLMYNAKQVTLKKSCSPQDALKELVRIALSTSKLAHFIQRESPTVIT